MILHLYVSTPSSTYVSRCSKKKTGLEQYRRIERRKAGAVDSRLLSESAPPKTKAFVVP